MNATGQSKYRYATLALALPGVSMRLMERGSLVDSTRLMTMRRISTVIDQRVFSLKLIFVAVLLMFSGCEMPRDDDNLSRFNDFSRQSDTASKEGLKGREEGVREGFTAAEEQTSGQKTLDEGDEFARVQYHSELQHRKGLYYVVNEEAPFTGIAKRMHVNGQLAWKANIKNGKRNGLSRDWDENGKLESEARYEDDKLHGLSKDWYRNGVLKRERNYKNNKFDGLSRLWSRESLLRDEICYSKGERVSIQRCQRPSSE